MVAMIGSLILASALAVSVTVIWAMVAPQWRRIVALAAGHPEPTFAPLAQLAIAERRIAVRRSATRPSPAPVSQVYAAA